MTIPIQSIAWRANPPRSWRAKWIWGDDDGKTPNSYRYFRRIFALDEVPDSTLLCISADTRYKVFLNGELLGQGPPQSQPFYQYYDIYDIASALQEGENCVAVIVNYVGNAPDTRGGLLLEMLSEQKTAAQASREYGIKDSVLSRWKQEFVERAPLLFEQAGGSDERERRIAELERLVGRQAMELEMAKGTRRKHSSSF